jgi:hypothetical protein
VRPKISPALQRRLAKAVAEAAPFDLGPARLRALRQAPPGDYYAALADLRREDWEAFLRRVPPSRRRTALRALGDVVDAADARRLARLVPAARPRRSPARIVR